MYTCKVDIKCIDGNNVPCPLAPLPDRICTVGNDIFNIILRIREGGCHDSRNSQDETFQCSGSDIDPQDTNLTITCVDDILRNELEHVTGLRVGNAITVRGINGTALPEAMECRISNSILDPIQTITLNPSGGEDIFLKDRFGALELDGCNGKECFVTFGYFYELTNVGFTNSSIESLERRRTGLPTEDIVENIFNRNLTPGSTTIISETEVVDGCLDQLYTTTLDVVALPPDGKTPCVADDKYEFDVQA